ncbi:alpha/beta hydrolase [Novosphingobium sp. MW5]|nr:alpha/beta hydrolase [Novosphingobium sp. MW5]
MTRHLVDEETALVFEIFPPHDLTEETLPHLRTVTPLPDGVLPPLEPEVLVASRAGQAEVAVRVFRTPDPDGPRPLILHIHGGGYVAGSAEMMDMSNAARALQHGVVVASVEYRLAPEHPYPAAVEDCYTALSWLVARSKDLDIDLAKVVIMGESAGGGLAAALALLCRDRGGPVVSAQFLIYPMLDYRVGTDADPYKNPTCGEFIWTRASNRFGWASLAGSGSIPEQDLPYFSPALAQSLAGLPKTYMATGSLDLFFDENLNYASRLSHAGVPVELHAYAGAVHAFDLIPTARVSQCFAADLDSALGRWL